MMRMIVPLVMDGWTDGLCTVSCSVLICNGILDIVPLIFLGST